MFQFPRCPPATISGRVTAHHGRRVAPFGHRGITGCQPLPRAFRRVAASFLGCRRQGIHRPPIFAPGSLTPTCPHVGARLRPPRGPPVPGAMPQLPSATPERFSCPDAVVTRQFSVSRFFGTQPASALTSRPVRPSAYRVRTPGPASPDARSGFWHHSQYVSGLPAPSAPRTKRDQRRACRRKRPHRDRCGKWIVKVRLSLAIEALNVMNVNEWNDSRPIDRSREPGGSLPGGAAGTRTPDLRRAKAALSQLSYGPVSPDVMQRRVRPVGAPGLEPGTSALSGPRSNHLSYAPSPALPVCSVSHSRAPEIRDIA